MKTHRHRRHSTEFKLRIVQAYFNGEGSIKGIIRQHDISHNLLRIWLEKFRRGELTEEGDRKERIRGKRHPASGKGCKRIPSSPRAFPRGDLLAVPSNAQDEGDEEPDAAGSTPGSPPPMLNPAST